jgi:translation initiation factor IF-3
MNQQRAGGPAVSGRSGRDRNRDANPLLDGGVPNHIFRRLRIRHFDRQAPPQRGPRVNEQINISPIRLIGAEGEQLGVVSTAQALQKAREADLDLVEVAPDDRPPVCRILDYGKMRFRSSQKGGKGGKARPQKTKEIRVRPKTGDHDVETKVAQARRFLEHNDKVQLLSCSAAARCSTRRRAGGSLTRSWRSWPT